MPHTSDSSKVKQGNLTAPVESPSGNIYNSSATYQYIGIRGIFSRARVCLRQVGQLMPAAALEGLLFWCIHIPASENLPSMFVTVTSLCYICTTLLPCQSDFLARGCVPNAFLSVAERPQKKESHNRMLQQGRLRLYVASCWWFEGRRNTNRQRRVQILKP